MVRKTGRIYDVKTVEARAAQKLHKNLSNEIAELEKRNKIITNTIENSKEDLATAQLKFEKGKDVFQTDLCNAIDSMKLKRQVYHSGAIVGNDVDKLTTPENIKKLSGVFKPRSIELPDRQIKVYSDTRKSVKMNVLLTKFQQCCVLYSKSRPLCKHEVAMLSLRCASFGSWFPVNFPNESVKPKFHCLTYHVPEKAKLRGTVGMETENCSEMIHPVVNKLNRTYHTVQNVHKRLELITKSQWLKSNKTIRKNFRKPINKES